jgi:outer membrane protein
MKTATKTIALLVLGLIMSTAATAQKTGYVELDSVVKWMPESKKAEAILVEYGKALEKEITNMQEELKKKMDDANKVKNAPQIVVDKMGEDIYNLQQRIEQFRQKASEDYQRKTAELSFPIYQKAKKGVEAVAKENGYKYILDKSPGMILYSEASDDLTLLVKKKLGAMPEAVLPGAPAAAPTTTTTQPKGTGTTPKPATPAKSGAN